MQSKQVNYAYLNWKHHNILDHIISNSFLKLLLLGDNLQKVSPDDFFTKFPIGFVFMWSSVNFVEEFLDVPNGGILVSPYNMKYYFGLF